METETASLAARVRALRRAHRLTQEQLAAKAGIGKNYLWRIEKGERANPSQAVLLALARALDVSLTELAGQTALRVPDPWLLDIADRLDALPAPLRVQAQAVIEDLLTLLQSPLLAYAAEVEALLRETAELDEAELQELARYTLHLVQQAMTAPVGGAAASNGAHKPTP